MAIFNILRKAARKLGIKNKYTLNEIKKGGNVRAAVLLTDEERMTFTKQERLERFRKWRKAEGQ
jgi:hypothetical protein